MTSAKNLALAGIKSLTLHDQNAIAIADLSSQVPPFSSQHLIVPTSVPRCPLSVSCSWLLLHTPPFPFSLSPPPSFSFSPTSPSLSLPISLVSSFPSRASMMKPARFHMRMLLNPKPLIETGSRHMSMLLLMQIDHASSSTFPRPTLARIAPMSLLCISGTSTSMSPSLSTTRSFQMRWHIAPLNRTAHSSFNILMRVTLLRPDIPARLPLHSRLCNGLRPAPIRPLSFSLWTTCAESRTADCSTLRCSKSFKWLCWWTLQ